MNLLRDKKIGFIGTGNMAQAIIEGLLESDTLKSDQIIASNRTEKKLERLADKLKIQMAKTNEEVIERSDYIFIATKPQDLFDAVEPIAMSFDESKTVISLAAGIRLETLEKTLPEAGHIVHLITNTPIKIGKAVVGYCMNEDSQHIQDVIEKLLSPLGYVLKVQDDEMLSALTVGAASGVGFVFEMMSYWVDWLQGYGYAEEEARLIAIHTFLGGAQLALDSQSDLEELIANVASKKGVTQAGLDSIRELDIERALRISFEKALLRDKELGR